MSPSLLTACGQYNRLCISVVIHTAAAFHHLKFVRRFLCLLFTTLQCFFFHRWGLILKPHLQKIADTKHFKKKLKSHLVSLPKRLFLIHLDPSPGTAVRLWSETLDTKPVQLLLLCLFNHEGLRLLFCLLTSRLCWKLVWHFPSLSSSSCPNTFANIWELT